MSKIEVDAIDKQSGSTLTLGGSGTAVTLACGATQSGFGRTGTVNWCTTAKTSPFTATSGSGFFVNTTGGTVTVTLPSSPSAGDIVDAVPSSTTETVIGILFLNFSVSSANLLIKGFIKSKEVSRSEILTIDRLFSNRDSVASFIRKD